MQKSNFENKMEGNVVETKDLINIEGERMTRQQARRLRDELSKRLADETDRREYTGLIKRVSAINQALKAGRA